jgi:hypothetical protein
MQRIVHEVELDIFRFDYRPCRVYQERIADYYQDGKPRFEWERLRQKRLVQGDQVMERVCGPCPFNLLDTAEGCKVRIESLPAFITALAHLRPSTPLIAYTFSDDILGLDDTALLCTELQAVARDFASTTWPVAMFYDRDEPRRTKDGSLRELDFVEWDGNEETFLYSNPGYTIALTEQGLLVRELDGDVLPNRYRRLWQESAAVWGETMQGDTLPFIPRSHQVPAWDSSGPFSRTQLRFVEMPLLGIYADVVDTLSAFGEVALAHHIGLRIHRI